MKKLSAFLASAILFITTTAFAGSFYMNDAAGLTGAVVCDEQIHDAYWFNNLGGTLYITDVLTWVGVDYNGKGDVWVFLDKVSTGEPFTFVAWDHYANPTALHQFAEHFDPPFEVANGDGIRFSYFCQAKAKHMQIITKVRAR